MYRCISIFHYRAVCLLNANLNNPLSSCPLRTAVVFSCPCYCSVFQMLVLLDVRPSASLQEKGLVREVINRVQKLRKKAKLVPSDKVFAYYEVRSDDSTAVKQVVVSHNAEIVEGLKTSFMPVHSIGEGEFRIIEETSQVISFYSSCFIYICFEIFEK